MKSREKGAGLPNVTLYCREGTSDKVYQACVTPAGAGYLVRFAYGRRGTQLKIGMKTPRIVRLDEATAVFDRLVREKRGKGYRDVEGAPATPAAPTAPKATSNVRARKPSTAAPRSIIDPVFGPLVWDGGYDWTTKMAVPGFGDRVSIGIDAPNGSDRRKAGAAFVPSPPTPQQRRALQTFLANAAQYRAVMEDINWRFYNRYRSVELDEDDSESRRRLPNVKEAAGVWKLLSRPSIAVPVQPKTGWWIELNWECRWDREHGHKVVLRNGKESYAGQQGGA